MLRNIIFDMGGVLITIDHAEAVRRFTEIGVHEAARLLDPYTQGGPFGQLEQGDITTGEFVLEMSRLAGRTLSHDDCAYGWLGYAKDAPLQGFRLLEQLRCEGYHLILLSNMNPFINAWLEDVYTLPEFFSHETPDGLWRDRFPLGRPLSSFFEACYRSFEIRMMKPDPRVFRLIVEREGILPEETLLVDDGPRNCSAAAAQGLQTFQPQNGEDWTQRLLHRLA